MKITRDEGSVRVRVTASDDGELDSSSMVWSVEANLLYEILMEMKKLNQTVHDISMEQSGFKSID